MKYSLFLITISCFLFVPVVSLADKDKKEITLTTWNIRRQGKEKNKIFSWEQRKGQVESFLQHCDADIYCFQEVTPTQLIDIRKTLSGYDFVAKPRKKFASSFWQRI